MSKGHFAVVDGGDGAGKTSQLELLRRVLPGRYGRECVFTREPGGTPFAERIRAEILLHDQGADADGLENVLLFGAARFNHLRTLVIPAVLAGKLVVTDRFDTSSFAYQLIAQEGGAAVQDFFLLQRRYIGRMFADAGILHWTTIILDIDASTAMQRARGRMGQGVTHFDARAEEFHERVRTGLREYARRFPHGTHLVDGSAAPEVVHARILELLDAELGE